MNMYNDVRTIRLVIRCQVNNATTVNGHIETRRLITVTKSASLML